MNYPAETYLAILNHVRDNPGQGVKQILQATPGKFQEVDFLIDSGLIRFEEDESIRRFYLGGLFKNRDDFGTWLSDTFRRFVSYYLDNRGTDKPFTAGAYAANMQELSYPVGFIISTETVQRMAKQNPSLMLPIGDARDDGTFIVANEYHPSPAAIVLEMIARHVRGPVEFFQRFKINDLHVIKPAPEPEAVESRPRVTEWPELPDVASKSTDFSVYHNDDGTVTVNFTGKGEHLAGLMTAYLEQL